MSDIVPYKQNQIIASFDDAERAARSMAASGFFQDARQAAQALVKILAGQELGFGPFASMTGVSIIQGKPAVGANLQAAAVKKTGKYNYRVIEMTNEACELEFYENGKPVGKSRFDMKDAAAAGLSGKDNWKKWPRNMLFARAISNGVKWYAPDIFNGATVYTPDELGAMENEDGQVVDAESHEVEPAQASQPAPRVSRPEPQPAQASAPATVKQASIKTSKFTPIAAIFAGTFPEYADKNGNPNMYHILGAVAKCGFSEITDANVEAVKDAIYARALEAHSSDHEKAGPSSPSGDDDYVPGVVNP